MEVKNCPRCGKVFTVLPSKSICHDCELIEEEEYKKVKEYIEEHRDCNLDSVVAETEVPLKRIAKFIREGRLEISPGLRGDFRCEACNCEITRGRFCPTCLIKIKNDIDTSFTHPDIVNARSAGRMHLSKKL